jgi:hypothetical protein
MTKLTENELKEVFERSKQLLASQANWEDGAKSAADISADFVHCRTAAERVRNYTIHFATRDYGVGDYSRRIDSREFDRPLGRRGRNVHNHVLIFSGSRSGKKSKKFVALESKGNLDMHCHSHTATRRVLEELRRIT